MFQYMLSAESSVWRLMIQCILVIIIIFILLVLFRSDMLQKDKVFKLFKGRVIFIEKFFYFGRVEIIF